MGKLRKNVISIILVMAMVLGVFAPLAEPVEASGQKVTGKPIVVLMEYQDYKFSDIDKKEDPNNRVRGTRGEDFTAEFVQEWLFGESTYSSKDWDGNDHDVITIRKAMSEVSGGTYDFNGKVFGPYTAKHEGRFYGKNGQDSARLLVEEAIEAISKDPNVDLSDFDVETRVRDRSNFETEITFNQPDGQVDTVIVIHPGLGGEWGGGIYGDDSIWPFRRGFTWYGGEWGLKEYETKDHKGKDWRFDDFVIVSQDCASDIVMHEFGHALGLPDLYATQNGQPPVQYWDIMGGSYTGKNVVGDGPISYGAYNRYYLQKAFEKGGANFSKWANIAEYDLDEIAGQEVDLRMSVDKKDGMKDLIKINLPKKETAILESKNGGKMFFTGKGDGLRNSMLLGDIDLRDYSEAFLEFDSWYKIDPNFDFASVRVAEKGDKREIKEWDTLKGNITTDEFDKWLMENETEEERLERNPGQGITGDSKGWLEAEFDLSAYVGKEIQLAFYFHTDENTPEEGMYFDNIKVTASKEAKVEEPVEPEEPVEEEEDKVFLEEKDQNFVVGEQNYFKFNLEKEEEVLIKVDYEDARNLTWAIYDDETGQAIAYPLETSEKGAYGKFKLPKGEHTLTLYGSTDPVAGNFHIRIEEYVEEVKEEEKPVEVDKDKDPNKEWTSILEASAKDEDEFIYKGFSKDDGVHFTDHYYLLEWRHGVHGKTDGGLDNLQVWNKLNYESGLLVWYVNEYYIDEWNSPDQNTGDHPGFVFAGVVDADQNQMEYVDSNGRYNPDARVDYNMHDATFSLKEEKEFKYDWGSVTTHDRHTFMVPDFDDSRDYSNPGAAEAGLILENHGLKFLVLEEAGDRSEGKVKLMRKNGNYDGGHFEGMDLKFTDKSVELSLEGENLGKKAYIGFVKGDERVKMDLKLVDGVYKNNLNSLIAASKGEYDIEFIVVEDRNENARAIYNSRLYSGYGMDLGKIDNSNLIKGEEIKDKVTAEIKFTDKNQVEPESFKKGELVLTNVEIKGDIEEDSLVIIEATDGDDRPYAIRYVKYTGPGNYDLGFNTFGAEAGKNKVKVLVWNNLEEKKVLMNAAEKEFILK